jgi:voltage-gated sodium channel
VSPHPFEVRVRESEILRRPVVTSLARRISESRHVQNLVLAVIVLTAVAVGLETYPDLVERHVGFFTALDWAIQTFFVLEIAIRLLACWPRPLRFFSDGWNVFDFVVVAASLLPQSGTFAMVARLARLLRVTRLVAIFPELRLIVSTMLRSIPSMGHVIMMLSLLLYVYAVLGVTVFRDEDPEHWGNLGVALLTLFQMLTLEGWVEIQDQVLTPHPWAWAYFASFVLLAVFVVVNLFIAVVINNLETAKLEQQAETDRQSSHHELLRSLEDSRKRLEQLEHRLRQEPPPPGGGSPA